MAKNRVFFVLWLLLWLAVWLLGSGNLAGCVLLASLLSAAAEIGLSFIVRRNIAAQVSTGLSCQKGERLSVTLTVKNDGLISCAGVRAVLRCRNHLTGETEEQLIQIAAAGRSVRQAQCGFLPQHCGKLTVEAVQMQVLDSFGLIGFRMPSPPAAAALVMPEIYPVDIGFSARKSPDADSDEYSMYHAGEDPSETFALREYVPGDSVRRIHWKLTEKTDRLMVRQLGLPEDDSLLLVLDSGASNPVPDACEALGEAAVSVSAALCGEGVPHRIAYWKPEAGAFAYSNVSDMDELTQTLPELLSVEIGRQEDAPPWPEEGKTDYAHMVVLTLRPEPAQLTEEAAITFLPVTPDTLTGGEALYLAL